MKLGQSVKLLKRVADDQSHWHEIGERATVKMHAAKGGKEVVQIEFGGCVFGRGRATVPVVDVEVV